MYAFYIVSIRGKVGMTHKYEITDIQHPENPKLFRIRALRDIPRFEVKVGELGGYIEHEGNLSHEGDCWIKRYARAYENAQISGNAQIFGEAQISDGAKVYGDACVYENAQVTGNAQVYDHARVGGIAKVFGEAQISEHAWVFDRAIIHGSAS